MKKTLLTIAIAITFHFTYSQDLPLTAGSSYPLTNDLFVKNAVHYLVGTTEYGVQFANAGALGNEAYQGTYWFVGTGSGSSTIERMRITNGGNVGIGTTSPSSALDIGGNLQLSGINSLTPPTGLSYGLFPYSGVGLGLFSGAIAPNQGIGIWTNPSGVKTEVMRILSGGNVGIGTTSPKTTLQLGDASSGVSDNTGELTLAKTVGGGHRKFKLGLDANYSLSIGDYGTNADDTYSSYFTMTYAGNVGIGTINPDAKLTVQGTIHSTEIKIDLHVPIPDYVFKPDYKLPNLIALKAYVDKNHHLPEIPSAEKMAKDGLNLGEMNTKLLKKVEELTLYLIGQNKQLINQQKSNQEQQKKLEQQEIRLAALEKALSKLTVNK
jgi:hypothetical protein